MNRLSLSLAAAVLIAATSTAFAADLPMRQTYAPAVAPLYNWTGFYVGINGGYGWGQKSPLNVFTNRFDNVSIDVSGGMVGGTAGAQIQSGHVVLGLEADLDWADISGTSSVAATIFGAPFGLLNLNSKTDSVSTARVRVGYALDNWLLYATGGASVLGNNTHVSTINGATCVVLAGLACSGTSRQIGAAAGLGVEYGFTPNWSAKLEYMHFTAVSLSETSIDSIRLGLNYRFGGTQ
jgi:outer membrane immunogenic protein